MIRSTQAVRRRLSLALGTSTLAIGLALPVAAQAQCAPDPTVENGITTCTGTDADGIRVTTPGTALTVAGGASVSNTGAPAIAVDVPRSISTSYSNNTVTVQGSVSAPGQAAITVSSGAPTTTYYYSTQLIALTVGAGGSVTGATALALQQSPGNGNGTVSASVDNAGTLTGTGGIALMGNVVVNSYGYPTALTSFSTITNRAGATITGGIVGPVSTLANAGTINGGTGSALDSSAAFSPVVTNDANAAIISASGAATVLAGPTYSLSVTNAGIFANRGSGAALGGGTITVTNQAGGQIASAGSAAISATGSVNLVNLGSVTGDVIAGNGSSMIDSTAGTISGSVTLGSGYDTLIARYAGSRTLATGINGAINAGGGTNTERVVFATDTSVTTPIDLNSGFQQLVLAPAAGVTATLETGFSTSSPLVVAGAGTLVNRATIALSTQAVSDLDYSFGTRATFRNEGSITASVPSTYGSAGLTFSNHIFTNTGTVTVTGGTGVSMSYNPLVNSGLITATGTGVTMFDAVLTNDGGTIVSTGGTGVYLSGNVGYTASNSGTIRGLTTGATTDIYLTNTGTISSAGTGVSVQPYGWLINGAGGVVNGGSGGAVTVNSSNAGVSNAGTIDGNVSFSGSGTYIALTGGVLNGNLSLSGATLVTDLDNPGPGMFAGITGTVTADAGSTLRYAVHADTATTLPAGNVGPFATVGYQLDNAAALTLTAPDGQTRTQSLLLAGNGSVDLTAGIATTNAAAIQSTSAITYPGAPATTGALSITSRGAITFTRNSTSNDYYNYYSGAVVLASGDSFTNAGSITATDRTSYGLAAISAGASVTNTGTITLDGATGISSAAIVSNTGLITQANNGTASRGVVGFASLTNSGTISVSAAAAQFGSSYFAGSSSAVSTITNTGTLASTGGTAITSDQYSYGPLQIINQAGGTITGVGSAIQIGGASVTNAGAITGTVDLGYAAPYYDGTPNRSYASSTYVAAGGTVAGDLLFGRGTDLFLQTGDTLGVLGIIDGGEGTDIYGHSLSSSGTVAIDASNLRNFEDALVQAVGPDTVVTATATGTFGGNLYAIGMGSIVNQATIAGALTTSLPYSLTSPYAPNPPFPADQFPASLTNAGSVNGGVSGTVASFTNTGTIASSVASPSPFGYQPAVELFGSSTLAFANSGTISDPAASSFFAPAVSLYAPTAIMASNSGRIDGGVVANLYGATDGPALSLDFANTGTITAGNGLDAADFLIGSSVAPLGGAIRIANSGTISAQGGTANGGAGSASALILSAADTEQPLSYTLTNSGTISATAATSSGTGLNYATALIVDGTNLSGTITNAAGGTISATGDSAFGVVVADGPLDLVNAGTITAAGRDASVAVATFDAFSNTIRNTGTITGDILLSDGVDAVDNGGTIAGTVSLGAGDDSFVQRAGSSVTGIIDGGTGTNAYRVDTSGGTATVAASGFTNFGSVTQTGTGTGTYSGSFGVETIALAGGTLAVAAGQTLSTTEATTITGIAGSGSLTVDNAGTIAGGITLADGNGLVVNNGAIGGRVQLGSGDDTFVEGAGSTVQGGVDGGAGTNLYRVTLAGDRSGIGARTNFQNLAVDGAGTLTLALDQSFGTVALNGTSLSLALAGHTVGQILATGAATQLTLDGDVGAVQLGAGADTLTTSATLLAGRYDGGAGADLLQLTGAGPVAITGAVTGFETVALAGNAVTVSGTLGSTGASLAFAGGSKSLTVARGGVLAGSIDLGAGDDSFRLEAGGMLAGNVSGGAGTNAATLALAGDVTLRAGSLTGFQRLATEGGDTLTLAGGSFAYDTLTVAGGLTVAADAGLTGRVAFGSGDNRLAIAGAFAGSVDGGAGNDSIEVSGGSLAAPVAFASIADVEAYRMSGGLATVSGVAALGNVTLIGGRLVGLAGSTMTAASFNVGQGATFGSAGTVNGNVAVSGTLSPGASPGTMTVNGNVSLASGSTSLFEITPTVSDKLVVNGAVSIANGATLQLAPTGTLRPGTSYDLVVASGGITGGFTTVIKPDSLFGFLVQRADRIQLLGQFLSLEGATPQVNRSIAYANVTLSAQPATSTLFAALPALLTAGGASNAQAFARLTPEPYAAATQLGVDNALTLVAAARGPSFAATGEGVHAYTFATTLGQWHRLGDDPSTGASATRTQGYGFLGGIGVGSTAWSVGAFGGYLNDRQRIDALAAQTKADGLVAGVHGRVQAAGGLGLSVSALYDGGQARTGRVLPGGGSAVGRYDLHSIVGDVQVSYEAVLPSGWALRPHAGFTYVRTTRQGAAEAGGSAFALTVARDRHDAAFADAGLFFGRGEASAEPFRPWVSFGARYQTEGTSTDALAGYAGGALALEAVGPSRSRAVGTAAGGIAYRLPSGLDLFASASSQTGIDDHQESISAGVRLSF